jgi:hypothetical protein
MANNSNQPVRLPGDARPVPPRWADQLLEWFVAPHLLEYVQGDLHEVFARRVEQVGAARARREYARAVLHCLTPFFAKPIPKQYPNPTHIDMIRNYFTVARRALLKHRAYSGLNIAGLAVGLTTTMLILLWVKDEISVDRFHANHDRIYRVVLNLAPSGDKIATYESVTTPIISVAKREVPGVVAAIRFSFPQPALLSYKGKTIEEHGHQADPDFLKMFSFPLVKGDAATALTAPNTILITRKLADKYFQNEEPLGKIMRMDQRTDVTVVGILADVPSNSTLQFDFLVPYAEPLAGDDNWENNNKQAFIMLNERQARSPSAATQVNAHLKALFRKYQPEMKDRGYVVSPMRDWYLRWDWDNGQYGGGGRITYVRLFSIVASFVLLIACINFMNLSTARASQRAKEVGVRKAIGADRGSLVGQFLGESLLLTIIAGLLALGLLFLMLPFFNQLLNKQIAVEYANLRYIAAYAGILLLTSLLAGIYPAFVLSAFQPVKVLKGLPDRTAGGAVRLRQSLVVVQFTVSILLVVGTIVVYQQIDYIRNKNLGYQKENLVIVETKGLNSQNYEQTRRTLEAVPGVQAITAANTNFRGPNWRDFPTWPGKPADKQILFSIVVGDYDLLPTMKMQLRAGRNFSRSFGRDSVNVIINEEAARLMHLKQPVGHEITVDGRKGNIIGLVKDFNLGSIHSPIEPTVILCRPERTFLFMARIDSRQVPYTLANMETAYKSLLPGHPFNYQFADAEYDKMYRSEMQIGTLANWFSVLAIFISCLGLFGLASFTVERRTKEIGVRKVLGASLVSIFGLISREFIVLVIIALVLAIVPAWYLMNNWLRNFAYSVDIQWWVFVLAGIFTIGVALLTVSFQSIKAALMNPAKSLRSE